MFDRENMCLSRGCRISPFRTHPSAMAAIRASGLLHAFAFALNESNILAIPVLYSAHNSESSDVFQSHLTLGEVFTKAGIISERRPHPSLLSSRPEFAGRGSLRGWFVGSGDVKSCYCYVSFLFPGAFLSLGDSLGRSGSASEGPGVSGAWGL